MPGTPRRPPAKQVKARATQRPRVLHVEDSPTQAEAIRACLDDGGYDVTLARSGAAALDVLGGQTFDVVISDIVMPGDVDGYELCRRVKAGTQGDMPVVLLTSLSDPMDIIRGLEAGADNFLTKPCQPDHLLDRLREILATRQSRARGRVRAGVTVYFMGSQFTITSDREQILDLLVSTFEDAVRQNHELRAREESLAQSQQSLASLYGIAVDLNACNTEAEVAEAALTHAVKIPGVRAGWLVLRDGDTGFRLAASRNLPPALQAPGAMDGDCACRRRLLAGELDQVTNIMECERLAAVSGDTQGLRFHATVPLWIGRRTVGILNLVGNDRGLVRDEDRPLLYGVGNQIATALERARLMQHLEAIVEQRTTALREREHQLSSIYETAADVLFQLAVEPGGTYRFKSVNPAFLTVTGLKPELVVGRRVDEIVPEPSLSVVLAHYAEAIREKRVVRWEETSVYPTGELTGEVSVAPVCNAAGECTHLVGAVHDVTERKRVETALRQSEERFRNLVNEVNDGFFVTDEQGRYTYANRALALIHGFSDPAQLIGHGILEFVAPSQRHQVQAQYRAGMASGKHPESITVDIVRPDGQTAAVEVKPVAVYQGERPIGTRGVVRDITERVRAEEQLREAARLLLASQRVAHLGSYQLDVVRGTWTGSSVLDEILGITDPAFPRDTPGWLTLVHPDQQQELATYFTDEVLGKGQGFDREYRIIRPNDGAERWVHGLGELVKDADGRVVRMIGTIQDITDRKRLEDQFRQAQKMEAVGRLAGGVAHDFNNILTAIIGTSALMLDYPAATGPLREDIVEIQRAADRAATLTRQLLAFSRKQILQPRVLSLNHVVEDIESMLRRIVGEDVAVTMHLAADLESVHMDPSQIEQIIVNLAVNARDAMPQGGTLSIATQNVELDEGYAESHASVSPGAYVMLAVSDTGVGMGDETKAHLFEPFFTTKEAGKGTGLGLATVYGIVKQSGGSIWVYSEPGRGATFKIYLPQVRETPEHVRKEPGETPAGGAEVILLAEDDDSVRAPTATILRRQGYTVLEAANGREAMALVETHQGPIDLILTDVVMPELGGVSMVEQLRPLRPEVKVLYISGYTDDAIARQGLLRPGAHYLEKPFTPVALLRRVRQVLDARS
ncbi:MAG TPA: PAS domain S-box protein [Gemmatimonadales bacterium]